MRRLKEIVYFHFQASYISSSFTFNFLLKDESNKTEEECNTSSNIDCLFYSQENIFLP